jgi:uncharacterized protein
MKPKRTGIITALLFIFVSLLSYGQASTNLIRVLIVDGLSNHDWKQTTMVTKQILENSGLFEVSVSTAPSTMADTSWRRWDPVFSHFDVVIQNYNNLKNKEVRWPKIIERELEGYVKKGGGLYILHSANNSFEDWAEYNLMIGMGWRSKDEGDALEVGEGDSIIRIPSGEGADTSHGKRFDAVIQILNRHPINEGYPDKWKTPNMELYLYARGPAKNVTVLSFTEDPLSGRRWPVEWLVQYRKGYVYNSSMGHLWEGETYPDSYRCVGFQTTMIRTLEWLARHEVTYPVPDNFPTENTINLRSE